MAKKQPIRSMDWKIGGANKWAKRARAKHLLSSILDFIIGITTTNADIYISFAIVCMRAPVRALLLALLMIICYWILLT